MFGRHDPKFDQIPPPCPRSLPLLPMIETHPPPYPFVEFQHSRLGVADAEVVHPALGVASQFVDDEFNVLSSVAFGDLIRCAHPAGSLAAVYLRFDLVPSLAV